VVTTTDQGVKSLTALVPFLSVSAVNPHVMVVGRNTKELLVSSSDLVSRTAYLCPLVVVVSPNSLLVRLKAVDIMRASSNENVTRTTDFCERHCELD
jgi:hypothetical protein